jgi:hypothetical protein
MNAVSHKLSPDLMAEMAAIRLAVAKLPAARLFCNNLKAVDLIDQGNRMVRCFENWLLDDEQKQVLSSEPWDMFILYASSYLHDISLTNSDVDDAIYNQLCKPIRKIVAKRFRDFVRINFAHDRRLNPNTNADGYNERWQQQVFLGTF